MSPFFPKSSRALVSIEAGADGGVSRIRDLCGVIERDVAAIGVFLTFTPPTRPMIAEAAAGPFEEAGLDSVPRIRIVAVEQTMTHRDRAIVLPARRDDAFKRALREEVSQGSLDL